jgi:alpha-2-macroglobulin
VPTEGHPNNKARATISSWSETKKRQPYISLEPANDLIPKLVRGLLDHRTQGRWANTQENVFILLALDKYFNTYEKVAPDFVARVWLGEVYAGEQQFKGRSVDRGRVNVPMSYLTDKAVENSSSQNLIVGKEGPGPLLTWSRCSNS